MRERRRRRKNSNVWQVSQQREDLKSDEFLANSKCLIKVCPVKAGIDPQAVNSQGDKVSGHKINPFLASLSWSPSGLLTARDPAGPATRVWWEPDTETRPHGTSQRASAHVRCEHSRQQAHVRAVKEEKAGVWSETSPECVCIRSSVMSYSL